MIAKWINAIVNFINGIGLALPQLAENKSKKLEQNKEVIEVRNQNKIIKLKRKQIKKQKRLDKKRRKNEQSN